tara:strand:- start:472 stop:606 length:135 start_codon:yes stop_codon:yes gene_type:complete
MVSGKVYWQTACFHSENQALSGSEILEVENKFTLSKLACKYVFS